MVSYGICGGRALRIAVVIFALLLAGEANYAMAQSANTGAEAMSESAAAGLVLWNKLGSDYEVLNSAYGPDLGFYAGGGSSPDGIANRKYVPGVFGNGVTIDAGTYSSTQRIRNIVLKNLPNYIDPNKGTIEVWYKQNELPVAYDHNPYRIFDGSYGLDSGIGFEVYLTELRFSLQFGGPYRYITYDANNLPNNQWIHLAAVWDRSGIDGTSETMRIYIDGNKIASSTYTDWGTTVGYWADIGGGNDQNIADKFAIDNLKIWNYAKTDFSDRFVEGIISKPSIGVDINITGTPVVGKSTKDILAADYRNFNSSDPYNITITRISDNLEVFAKNGTLTGEPKQTIPIDWTPQDTSDYFVVAKGDTMVASFKVTVTDSEVISPVPELSTIVLMSTGLLGLFGFTRLRRRD